MATKRTRICTDFPISIRYKLRCLWNPAIFHSSANAIICMIGIVIKLLKLFQPNCFLLCNCSRDYQFFYSYSGQLFVGKHVFLIEHKLENQVKVTRCSTYASIFLKFTGCLLYASLVLYNAQTHLVPLLNCLLFVCKLLNFYVISSFRLFMFFITLITMYSWELQLEVAKQFRQNLQCSIFSIHNQT